MPGPTSDDASPSVEDSAADPSGGPSNDPSTQTSAAQGGALPTFIIIGAMKAGTTSLFRHLATHPDISVSTTKETDFFLGRHEYERGLDWYRSLFDPEKPVRGEASPNYTKLSLARHDVAEAIAAVVPDVRLIFSARDPIDRLVSHWMHNAAHGREQSSFGRAIRRDDKYVDASRYAYQLAPFVHVFGRERILILDSDDLRDATEAAVHRTLEFIGARTDVTLRTGQVHHRSDSKTMPSVLDQRVRAGRLHDVLARRLPERWTGRRAVPRPEPSQRDLAHLTSVLADDAAAFRELSGMPFDQWRV